MLKVCIDTNVWISGTLFEGAPQKVVRLALKKIYCHYFGHYFRRVAEKSYKQVCVYVLQGKIPSSPRGQSHSLRKQFTLAGRLQ